MVMTEFWFFAQPVRTNCDPVCFALPISKKWNSHYIYNPQTLFSPCKCGLLMLIISIIMLMLVITDT